MKTMFLLVALAATFIFSACQNPVQPPKQEESKPHMSMNDESEWTAEEMAAMEMEEGGMMEGEEMMMEEEMVVSHDSYVDFSQQAYDSMLGKKPFAIFFHASWCPTCHIVEQDILANIADLPQGAVILKADYDTETALKQKYGISSQSLIVMVDAKGAVSEILVAPDFATIKASFANLIK